MSCILGPVFEPLSAGPAQTATQIPPFRLEVGSGDEFRRVVVSGELDLHTAPDLASTVIDLCCDDTREIEIDMREVRFIDSTGIRTLLVAADEAASLGIALRMIPSASRHVMKVFEITRTLDELPWSD